MKKIRYNVAAFKNKIMKKFAAFLIALLTTAQFASAAFIDLSSKHPYFNAIEFIQSRGIVNGYPDGSFQADRSIERYEMLKIVVESVYSDTQIATALNQYNTLGYQYVDLKDVPIDQWFSPYVRLGIRENVIQGYPNGLFQGTNTVNFVEALQIVMRSYDVDYNVDAEIWYEDMVKTASNINVIPLDITAFNLKITRGQMAELITRMIKYKEGTLDAYLGDAKDINQSYDDIKLGVNQLEILDELLNEGENQNEEEEEENQDEEQENDEAESFCYLQNDLWSIVEATAPDYEPYGVENLVNNIADIQNGKIYAVEDQDNNGLDTDDCPVLQGGDEIVPLEDPEPFFNPDNIKRLSEVQVGLEAYFADNATYPGLSNDIKCLENGLPPALDMAPYFENDFVPGSTHIQKILTIGDLSCSGLFAFTAVGQNREEYILASVHTDPSEANFLMSNFTLFENLDSPSIQDIKALIEAEYDLEEINNAAPEERVLILTSIDES